MDKYEQQLEHLAQRIRRLEAESLPFDMTDEMQSMMEELDLVPIDEQHSVTAPKKLNYGVIMDTLKYFGYNCSKGEDFVNVDTEEGRIQVNYDRLPIVTITNGYCLNESEEELKSIRKALNDIIRDWDMVKGFIDAEEKHLLLFLDARHEDAEGFRKNIRYYMEQIIEATKAFKDKYHDYERDRVLTSFGASSRRKILS